MPANQEGRLPTTSSFAPAEQGPALANKATVPAKRKAPADGHPDTGKLTNTPRSYYCIITNNEILQDQAPKKSVAAVLADPNLKQPGAIPMEDWNYRDACVAAKVIEMTALYAKQRPVPSKEWWQKSFKVSDADYPKEVIRRPGGSRRTDGHRKTAAKQSKFTIP